MNKLSNLKVYAATYVSESDLSVEDKVWLIDFIKEGEYSDVLNILEGEYQLPQITEYEAEMLNTYIIEAKPPPIPKKGGKPLRVRSNLGTSGVIAARQKLKATDKAVRKLMPDASKKSVKGVKHFTKPLRKDVWKAAGKSGLKISTAAGAIALGAAGGHALYQKYISKAARACKGKPNAEVCMANYRKKGKANKNIHKIKTLRVAKNDCINARNPVLCRRRIDSRIKKLKEEYVIQERGGLMGPLGIAFDILFIFELGSMAYKRFFSRAAKACKGSPDRKLCVLRHKIKAKELQMRTIGSKAGLCSKDANPANCKNKIMKKLQSIKSDVQMLKQELV